MNSKKVLCAAFSVLALTTLTGCGGSRLSADEVSSKMIKADPAFKSSDKKVVDCLSKVLVNSKISDKGVKTLAESSSASEKEITKSLSKEDNEVLSGKEFGTAATTCFSSLAPSTNDLTLPTPDEPGDTPATMPSPEELAAQ